jgi:hypothetical protein
MAAIWRAASARSASRSFMSGLLGGHPRRCPLRGRCAVWWDYRRGSFPRPFTIYAGNVEDVSLGVGDFARALTNSERRNHRRGDGGQRWRGTQQDSAGQLRWARTERRTETRSSSKDYVGAQDDAVNQRAPKSMEGKDLAPQDVRRYELASGEFWSLTILQGVNQRGKFGLRNCLEITLPKIMMS